MGVRLLLTSAATVFQPALNLYSETVRQVAQAFQPAGCGDFPVPTTLKSGVICTIISAEEKGLNLKRPSTSNINYFMKKPLVTALSLAFLAFGCARLPIQRGTWVGVTVPIAIYDERGHEHQAVMLRVESGTRIGDGGLKYWYGPLDGWSNQFLDPTPILIDRKANLLPPEKYAGYRLQVTGTLENPHISMRHPEKMYLLSKGTLTTHPKQIKVLEKLPATLQAENEIQLYHEQLLSKCATNEVICLWFSNDDPKIAMRMNIDSRTGQVKTWTDVYNWAIQAIQIHRLTDDQLTNLQGLLDHMPNSDTSAPFFKSVHIAVRKEGKVKIYQYKRGRRTPHVVTMIYDTAGGPYGPLRDW